MMQIVLLFAVSSAQLVAPGALTTGGGGGRSVGSPRRGGGWGTVANWPVGFYIAGSSLDGMNGLYSDVTAAHGLSFYCFKAWRNVESGWTIASANAEDWEAIGGRPDEWVIANEVGEHVVASKAGEYLPGAGPSWQRVSRNLRNFVAGDQMKARENIQGFWSRGDAGVVTKVATDGERRVYWRRSSDGHNFSGVGWQLQHLGQGSSSVFTGDDDDELPWMVIAMMDLGKLEDLIERQRAWRENESESQRRSRSSRPLKPEITFNTDSSLLLSDKGESCTASSEAREALCESGGTLEAADASFCERRQGRYESALAASSSAADGASLLERAMGQLDASLPFAAVATLERLYELDRAFQNLGDWLLMAHSRARRRPLAPLCGGFRVGETVKTVGTLDGFWRKGDLADVVGFGQVRSPIALKMQSNGRFFDVQPDRIAHVTTNELTTDDDDDHYNLLGVACDHTPEELRRGYRNASKFAHPDKNGGSDEKFARVAQAHAVLSDAERRRDFDTGEDLPNRPQEMSLREELTRHYFPELKPFEPFGDPLERKRQQQNRRQKQSPPPPQKPPPPNTVTRKRWF